MKKIKLYGKIGAGHFAIVDDKDFEYLNKFKWWARKSPNSNSLYAYGDLPTESGKRKPQYLHRVLLGLIEKTKYRGDHRNRNTLDCRRNNLRVGTVSLNLINAIKRKGKTTSSYKGVYWEKNRHKWRARLGVMGRYKHLGYFLIEKDAAVAYDLAALKEYGEFARINFDKV